MAHATTTKGTTALVNADEPLKFTNAVKKGMEDAVAKGFTVDVYAGGPDRFPVAHFTNKIHFIQFFVNIMTYWTKIKVEVSGKSDAENTAVEKTIIRSVGRQARVI